MFSFVNHPSFFCEIMECRTAGMKPGDAPQDLNLDSGVASAASL